MERRAREQKGAKQNQFNVVKSTYMIYKHTCDCGSVHTYTRAHTHTCTHAHTNTQRKD